MPGYEHKSIEPTVGIKKSHAVFYAVLAAIACGAATMGVTAFLSTTVTPPVSVAAEAPANQQCIAVGTTVVVEGVTSSKVSEDRKEEPDAFSMQSLVSYRLEDDTAVVCRHSYVDLVGVLKPGQRIKIGAADRSITRVL